MDLKLFHFSHPLWLLAALVIPLIAILFLFCYQKNSPEHKLEQFIDKHLLPYLILNKGSQKLSWLKLLLWSLTWLSLTVALAGPRWNLRELELFTPDQSLIIVLDLSESMNATDLKPSRLIRAKQKIEDLLNHSSGVSIGLVAFAADPHLMIPLTDDKETIRHLLPHLETSLIHVQGSRLSPALEMANEMLAAEPGSNKAILLVTDGGFEDSSALVTAQQLAKQGITLHTMGVGTTEGAPISSAQKKTRSFSKLEKERLQEISTVGHGLYLEASHSDQDEVRIIDDLAKRANAQLKKQKREFWDEYFYLFILPVLPIMLWWFRRSHLFVTIVLISFWTTAVEASAASYFKNAEQQGLEALEQGDYETAIQLLEDPYKKGVACYQAQQFAEAEALFRQPCRPEVSCQAAYNLGNALAQQQKIKKAIAAYEKVLKQWPDHTKAKENLELLKKLQEEQQQDQQGDESQEDDENEDSQDSDQENSDQQQPPPDKKNDSEEPSTPPEPSKPDDEEKNSEDSEKDQENAGENEPEEQPAQPETCPPPSEDKSEEEQNADLWLNQLNSDPKKFLKNKFFIESKLNETKEGIDPW